MKRFFLALAATVSALFALPAMAASVPLYDEGSVHQVAVDMAQPDCLLAGNVLAASKKDFPPGKWSTSMANAWSQVCGKALASGGFGLQAVPLLGGQPGRPMAFGLVEKRNGKFVLVVLAGQNVYGELAKLQAMLVRKAGGALIVP